MIQRSMTKKIDKISGYDRSLLRKLNTAKGFFLYGNRIRFTTNLTMNIAMLVHCLSEKPGLILENIIEDSVGPLANALNWDGVSDFWFERDELLLTLGSMYRFFDKEEAVQHEIRHQEIKEYPFVILLEPPTEEEYDIPVCIDEEGVWIGKGVQATLRSHERIPVTVLNLLKKVPTNIQS